MFKKNVKVHNAHLRKEKKKKAVALAGCSRYRCA